MEPARPPRGARPSPPSGGRGLLLPALLLTAVLGGCGENEPEPLPPWHEAGDHRWRELRVEGDGPGFTALDPSDTGLEFENRLSRERALENDLLLQGSGVALGDVDGDGRTDVYLTRLEGPNALYLNRGGWRFRDATDAAGVALPDRYSTGASLADVDGDGDLDLLVAALDGPTRLLRNDGSGVFSPDRDQPGLDSLRAGTTLTLADVDGDGDLDLYQAAHKSARFGDLFLSRQRMALETTVEEGDTLAIAPEYREHLRLEERGGELVPVEYGETDRLLLNDGEGGFRPVSWTGGRFVDEDGEPLEEAPDDFGLAARFYDVDGDGDPDLYVCNDFDDPDRFWINQGDGTFRQAPRMALRTTSQASMSVDYADVDRDGRVDFFVADMLSMERGERLRRSPMHALPGNPVGVVENRPQFGQNTLFWNRGDGTFAQIAELAGVEASEWTWGSAFLDVDLDGYEDLLTANGHLRDGRNVDAMDSVARRWDELDWQSAKTLIPEHRTRNAAFRNRGDLTFEPVGGRWGFGPERDVSHGLATGDLDGDGDQDVVVNRLREPALVLRNEARRSRLAVRLRGVGANTRGIGARVEVRVEGGAVPVQEKEMTAGGLYDSSPDPVLTFAAGDADRLRIEVVWPDGRTSVVEPASPDRLYEIRPPGAEATASDGEGGRSPPEAGPAPDAGPTEGPYFRDVSELLDHTHPESPFPDFRRQPLLPNRLSRPGPGVTWTDVDDDGDPDLVVTPGVGGRDGYLENTDGGFRWRSLGTDSARLDRTTALPSPGAALLVGRSVYEAPAPDQARAASGVTALAPGGDPGPPASTAGDATSGRLHAVGPLSMADVDGDGDLDLFVGGRSVPAFYPLAATSLLLVNRDGRFVVDPASRETFTDLGLVTGSLFSDVDGDGDPDLVLAMEWGPVRLFLNQGGRFREATVEWGLSGLTGRWHGVAAGDLDEDGRMDLVVTGWGRNVRRRPEPGRPLHLFHGDLAEQGRWHSIVAQRAPGGEELYPLERFELIRRAMPSVARRVGSFTRYAELTVEELIPRPLDEIRRLQARTYRHHLLLNRGGSYEARPLPTRAQFAPAFGATVADFDGDGHDDVFLSQNFFGVQPHYPRMDAGSGLWLRGDGTGHLEPVPASISGVRAWGEGRGAAVADYDGDGRVDLAVGQNGYRTMLFRNVGADPGLRVRLRGPPDNPDAVGARIRLDYGGRRGPAREIHAGSGYWSSDSPVQVLGLAGDPSALLVRWPDGREDRVPVSDGRREMTVEHPGR